MEGGREGEGRREGGGEGEGGREEEGEMSETTITKYITSDSCNIFPPCPTILSLFPSLHPTLPSLIFPFSLFLLLLPSTIGLSLWDSIVSNILSTQTDHHLTLVQHYHLLALPAHSLHLLLLSLVCLSLIDRYGMPV